MAGPASILFHPFESGTLSFPDGRCLFLGAVPGFLPPEGFGARLHLVQGFRPHFRALQSAGYAISPAPEGESFDGALVLAGRHRGRNEGWIADALTRVLPGGLVLVGGSGDDGIASLRKRVGKLIEMEGSQSKYHGIAFWFRRPDDIGAIVEALGPRETLVEGCFATRAGMFSHDRIDRASQMLADCLPDSVVGTAADFGAGWGYLSAELVHRTRGLQGIDLYEADHDSLEAAKANLVSFPEPPVRRFFWFDLVGETVNRQYDLIVMNPPFHQGRAADPGIGQGFIRAASSALRPGGRLLMVANRGLPYDRTLEAAFSSVRELRAESGFRVFSAIR